MGDQYIQPRLKQDVTEKEMYYTENFIDEDIFKITYNGGKYDIEKLEKGDFYFVLEDIWTIQDFGRYTHGINDDYILVGSNYVVKDEYGDSFIEGKNYLINIDNNGKRNGVFTCSVNFMEEKILTRHSDFDTYQKLKNNRTVKDTKTGKVYY